MHRRTIQRPGDTSIIPLINVVFLLLIFFLVSGTLRSENKQTVTLPLSETGTSQKENGLLLVLEEDGKIIIGKNVVSKVKLENHLKQLAELQQDTTINIHAAAGAPATIMVDILKILKQSGFAKIALITQPL